MLVIPSTFRGTTRLSVAEFLSQFQLCLEGVSHMNNTLSGADFAARIAISLKIIIALSTTSSEVEDVPNYPTKQCLLRTERLYRGAICA